MDINFDSRALRLEQKVYGTEKGYIRFELLKKDILDFCPDFTKQKMTILDAGGGSGKFSRFCAIHNHEITLCDISREMLNLAGEKNIQSGLEKQIRIIHASLMDISAEKEGPFDLVLLHGVAEWMGDPTKAIKHCCSLVKPGGTLSLLIYNKNKYLLKRGFNGRLLKTDKASSGKKKLTPPGRMSPEEIKMILKEFEGEVILQSGIRIFNNFLKIIEPLPISSDEWLEQECKYYRKEPFASLGEHSHIIWTKKE